MHILLAVLHTFLMELHVVLKENLSLVIIITFFDIITWMFEQVLVHVM